jgi:hypothetical protein
VGDGEYIDASGPGDSPGARTDVYAGRDDHAVAITTSGADALPSFDRTEPFEMAGISSAAHEGAAGSTVPRGDCDPWWHAGTDVDASAIRISAQTAAQHTDASGTAISANRSATATAARRRPDSTEYIVRAHRQNARRSTRVASEEFLNMP